MRAATLLAVSALLVAGCTVEPKPESEAESLDFASIDLEASDTTGILRGVVVDEAIRPLAGALIALQGSDPRNQTTRDDGLFGFDGLEPGTYFFTVTRLGYRTIQQSADVVAGEQQPKAVKVVLVADPAAAPFVEAQVYEGYIECTTSVLVLCGAPGLLTGQQLTNDRFTWDQYFTNNATHIQAEMVWESTQAVSPELYFEMEVLHGDCERAEGSQVSSFLNGTRGPSPIYATVNQTEIRDWDLGQVCPIYMSLFSGGVPGAPCGDADPTGTAPGWCAGATLQQRFTMYFHSFYNFMPNPGWRFTVDGQPVPPR